MNYWQYIIKVIPRWLLFALESYILFVTSTIFFPIIFDIQFTLSLYIIWLSFLIIYSITIASKAKSKFIFYFSLATLFLLSLWYWDKSLLIASSVLLVFFWRYSKVEDIYDLTLSSFLNRIKAYVAITGIFFLFTLFVDYQITNSWVVYSYLKVLIIYLISSTILQLSNSVNSKEIRRSLYTQTLFLFGGFSLILTIFYLTKDYIYNLLSLIKKGIVYFQIAIGQILEKLLNNLHINKEQGIKKSDSQEIINQNYDPLFEVPDDYVYSNRFWDYLEKGLLLLAILIIVLLIIRLIRRANAIEPNLKIKTSRSYLENNANDKLTNKRKKRFISANLYRKSYQRLLLWLVKVKIIKFNESLTSNEVKNIIIDKYPHLNTEIEQITLAYQQARYSKYEPDISLLEFKAIIRTLKGELNNY